MRFNEFKVETIDPNPISAKDSVGPGEKLINPQLYPKVGKKVEKTPMYPKVGFRVKVPANQRAGNDIADIQKVLIALDYDIGKTGPKGNGVDGINGQLTRAAIGKFQDDQNITVDKKIGPETVSALNNEIATRQLHLAHSTEYDNDKQVNQVSNAEIADITDPEFSAKLNEVAGKLRIDPRALWKVIKFESGGDPSKQNKRTKATGLIQFMPDTAIGLGTTIGELKTMSAVDQLDYVYEFYKGIRPGAGVTHLYLKTLLPAFAHKDDEFVVGQKGSKERLPGVTSFNLHDFWSANPIFRNKATGTITVGDIKNVILGKG
jgi:peptidoglycan hydrolase-like protein with peptidoglycan-binding domain